MVECSSIFTITSIYNSLGACDVFCTPSGPKRLTIKIDLLNDGE